MQPYLALVRRELGSLFKSWIAYVILAAVMLLLGVSFVFLLRALNMESTPVPLTLLFYDTFFFWIILLLVTPLITMRTLALEKSTGTFETLMTTPVHDAQVVLAKFTGALLFFLVLWLPLLPCLLIVRRFSSDPTALMPGAIAATYLGILLLGSVYLALGLFASALTRSQIVAAVVAYALGIPLFCLSFLGAMLPSQSGLLRQAVAHVAWMEHMSQFAQGLVDLRPVVLCLSLTALFLYLTLKAVGARRWR
ncbi:MAG: type transport system permease protein [Verrucomicrobiota bacterium]|jgi:ABC-2 type transport system permease protein